MAPLANFLGNTSKAYRPEIDGLRAIAVLAVIANHLGASVLPGGYLGVDMFFMISGYVVTSSLLARSESGGAALLKDFYKRRFKRLLPADMEGGQINPLALIRTGAEEGVTAMATLRTAALNLLRWAGFQSIRAGMHAVMHDMTALLAMVRRLPLPNPF